jgi:hypothetical protein
MPQERRRYPPFIFREDGRQCGSLRGQQSRPSRRSFGKPPRLPYRAGGDGFDSHRHHAATMEVRRRVGAPSTLQMLSTPYIDSSAIDFRDSISCQPSPSAASPKRRIRLEGPCGGAQSQRGSGNARHPGRRRRPANWPRLGTALADMSRKIGLTNPTSKLSNRRATVSLPSRYASNDFARHRCCLGGDEARAQSDGSELVR